MKEKERKAKPSTIVEIKLVALTLYGYESSNIVFIIKTL